MIWLIVRNDVMLRYERLVGFCAYMMLMLMILAGYNALNDVICPGHWVYK